MKKILTAILLILTATTITSCLQESEGTVTLEIKFNLPEGDNIPNIDLREIQVKLQNKNAPFNYISNLNKEGKVIYTVLPGKYDIVASAYDKSTRTAINASIPEFILTESIQLEKTLTIATPNPLIIRELYFHGSKTNEGESYGKDTYVELYNNGGPNGQTIYLDSICIAGVYPYNSTAKSTSWIGKDTIAIDNMFWMFPGNGHSHPLHPGESCVVAIRAAVDHSDRATSKLKLHKAHFGCASDALTNQQEIAAGVERMICYMTGQGTAWAFSINSPAFIVFKPEMGADKYMESGSFWQQYEPGQKSGKRYWHIAKEWIFDGVECFVNDNSGIKRLPGDIDASYARMKSPSNSGKCITRKIDFTEDGIEIFMDTNNSSNDFNTDCVPNPRLKN